MKTYKIRVRKIEVTEYVVPAEDRFEAYLKLTKGSQDIKTLGASSPSLFIDNEDISEIILEEPVKPEIQ